MTRTKPILLLVIFLFAGFGGCFGPLMVGQQPMDCCQSMPCSPASQSRSCCTAGLPGAASHLQQTTMITAPTVSYAVLPALPHSVAAAPNELDLHCYSPPRELYTIHHSFLI